MNVVVPFKRTIPTKHDEWACNWVDEKTGEACDSKGVLAGHNTGAYLRHVCYGHGPDRNPQEEPAIFYACKHHVAQFNREHGLDQPPNWLRRIR